MFHIFFSILLIDQPNSIEWSRFIIIAFSCWINDDSQLWRNAFDGIEWRLQLYAKISSRRKIIIIVKICDRNDFTMRINRWSSVPPTYPYILKRTSYSCSKCIVPLSTKLWHESVGTKRLQIFARSWPIIWKKKIARIYLNRALNSDPEWMVSTLGTTHFTSDA